VLGPFYSRIESNFIVKIMWGAIIIIWVENMIMPHFEVVT